LKFSKLFNIPQEEEISLMASPTTSADDATRYAAELERNWVNFPGLSNENIIRPKRYRIEPHRWAWSELRRLLHESADFQADLPQGDVGAERRIIRLQNPGVQEETVTDTMSVSIQLLLPGEVARTHRHTPSAFRFYIEGGAYTTVSGEKCEMRRGDLVITPAMEWHDHGNDGDEPAIWMDGLDYPLVRYLEGTVYQYADAKQQQADRTGLSERRYGAAGLRPYGHPDDEDTARRSLIHHRWETTHEALLRMAEAGDVNPFDDVMLQFVNPATGQGTFKTIACCIQMIRPGVRTRAHRHTGSAVYHVVEGSGETVIDGTPHAWERGDFLVVPPLAWHEHANLESEGAILFSIQDFPTLKALGLYREEAA
jgi:gentisate 1,2-dioxygenase